jgi:hypothetical protein
LCVCARLLLIEVFFLLHLIFCILCFFTQCVFFYLYEIC